MGVAGEVGEDLGGTGEGGLGVDVQLSIHARIALSSRPSRLDRPFASAQRASEPDPVSYPWTVPSQRGLKRCDRACARGMANKPRFLRRLRHGGSRVARGDPISAAPGTGLISEAWQAPALMVQIALQEFIRSRLAATWRRCL